jgi:hypothetical protein
VGKGPDRLRNEVELRQCLNGKCGGALSTSLDFRAGVVVERVGLQLDRDRLVREGFVFFGVAGQQE